MRERLAQSVVVQTLAALLGLVFALPFLYLMLVEWLAVVQLGGWFSYVMIGCALICFGGLAIHLLDRRYYLLSWLESDYRAVARAERARRRSERPSPDRRSP